MRYLDSKTLDWATAKNNQRKLSRPSEQENHVMNAALKSQIGAIVCELTDSTIPIPRPSGHLRLLPRIENTFEFLTAALFIESVSQKVPTNPGNM